MLQFQTGEVSFWSVSLQEVGNYDLCISYLSPSSYWESTAPTIKLNLKFVLFTITRWWITLFTCVLQRVSGKSDQVCLHRSVHTATIKSLHQLCQEMSGILQGSRVGAPRDSFWLPMGSIRLFSHHPSASGSWISPSVTMIVVFYYYLKYLSGFFFFIVFSLQACIRHKHTFLYFKLCKDFHPSELNSQSYP